MKVRLYTRSFDLSLLDSPLGVQITSAEYGGIARAAVPPHVQTTDDYVSWALSIADRRHVAAFLANFIERNGYRRVMSLGAGGCVLEYLVQQRVPGCEVWATDFNGYELDLARSLLPGLHITQFDFIQDQFTFEDVDLVCFVNSAYVLDDVQLRRLLSDIRRSGSSRILDFTTAIFSPREAIRPLVAEQARRILGREQAGKFHGYKRTAGAYRRIYRAAGWRVDEVSRVEPYVVHSLLPAR